jgi:hypothetical protein
MRRQPAADLSDGSDTAPALAYRVYESPYNVRRRADDSELDQLAAGESASASDQGSFARRIKSKSPLTITATISQKNA